MIVVDSDKIALLVALLILWSLAAFLAGNQAGMHSLSKRMEKDAIDAGVGMYNTQTGMFEYKKKENGQ